MSKIHPQAVVSSQAELGRDVVIEPFCVIGPGVIIGDGCRLASHVVVKEGTTLGSENLVCEGAVLGGMPQHVHVPERPGRLVIGRNNTIREYCTIHRSLSEGGVTSVGDNNLLMIGVHVAHDCTLGSNTIMTNNVLLAGHVTVDDRAYLSGAVGVHQFCRIGRLAMVGGQARIRQDVPPYVTVDGGTGLIVGLNKVGLKRNGFSYEQIDELKAAYRLIYRSGLAWRDMLQALEAKFPAAPAADFHQFFLGGTRGFVQERRTPPAATVRLHRELPEDDQYQSKAG